MVSALGVSYALLVVSVVAALVDLSATLWHMSWWIAVAFMGVVVLSGALVFAVIARPRMGGGRGYTAAPATGDARIDAALPAAGDARGDTAAPSPSAGAT